MSDTLQTNYAAAGGYTKYKLKFTSSSFISVPQPSGGMMDYYSSFGPVWHTYDMKPQIAAPGGHVLSTWPLGILGSYCILSGTSMATPYLAASYTLVKSQFQSQRSSRSKTNCRQTQPQFHGFTIQPFFPPQLNKELAWSMLTMPYFPRVQLLQDSY